MMKPKHLVNEIAKLIQYCVWGQMIGYLSFGVSMAIEDSPDIFSRASPWEFVWPILLLVAIHLFRLDSIIARLTPQWLIVAGVLSISLSTVVASSIGVRNAFGIPTALMTEGWRHLQLSSMISLAIFAISFVVSILLSFRVFQTSKTTEAESTISSQ
jgi:hypothetical protein